MKKDSSIYTKTKKVPPIGTRVKITSGKEIYVGKIFCTPYKMLCSGVKETHFSIVLDGGVCLETGSYRKRMVPVFVVGQCEIEIENDKADDKALLGAAFVGQVGGRADSK